MYAHTKIQPYKTNNLFVYYKTSSEYTNSDEYYQFCDNQKKKIKNPAKNVMVNNLSFYSKRLILNSINLEKGSNAPNNKEIGLISLQQLETIVKIKDCDLNTRNTLKAIKNIFGTATSIGRYNLIFYKKK